MPIVVSGPRIPPFVTATKWLCRNEIAGNTECLSLLGCVSVKFLVEMAGRGYAYRREMTGLHSENSLVVLAAHEFADYAFPLGHLLSSWILHA